MTIRLTKKEFTPQVVEYFSVDPADYVHFRAGLEEVELDGTFQVADLEIIISEMKRHLALPVSNGEQDACI